MIKKFLRKTLVCVLVLSFALSFSTLAYAVNEETGFVEMEVVGGGNQGGANTSDGTAEVPGNAEEGTTDPGYTEDGTTDPDNTEEGTTDPDNTEDGTTDPDNTEDGTTDPDNTEEGTTSPDNTEEDEKALEEIERKDAALGLIELDLALPVAGTVSVTTPDGIRLMIDGEYVYCYNCNLRTPADGKASYLEPVPFIGQDTGTGELTEQQANQIRAVLRVGYPLNAKGYQSIINPSVGDVELAAYLITQLAVWKLLGQLSDTDFATERERYPVSMQSYLDLLIEAGENIDLDFDIPIPKGVEVIFSYDEDSKQWCTDLIPTAGYGTYSLSDLPAGVTAKDVSGNFITGTVELGTAFQLFSEQAPIDTCTLGISYTYNQPSELYFYEWDGVFVDMAKNSYQNLIGWTVASATTGNMTYSVKTTDPAPTPDPPPTPTPDPDPAPGPSPTPDPGTPSTPSTPSDNSVIEDPNVPLADLPDLTDEEANEELSEIEDPEVPLGEAPETGDALTVLIPALGLLCSGGGLLLLLLRKKQVG